MKKDRLAPYLFIIPHFIIFVVFALFPLFWGISISFTKWNLFKDPTWVGLQNYKEIFLNKDSTFYFQFWNGLSNTVKFVLMTVPAIVIIPLIIALLMHTNKKGWKIFMTIFYLPSLLSISAVMLTWNSLFNRTLGAINGLLGLDINWISEQPFTWIALVIITVWWGLGGNLIIFLAGINDISPSLLEAADLDGANWFQKVWYVVIPRLKFQLLFTIVMSTIAQFNIYGQPLMFNNGGPSESTFVLMMYIKNLVWGAGNSIAGLGSTMAVMMGVLIAFISVFQFRLIKQEY